MLVGEVVGVCPACGGKLVKTIDKEGRLWAACVDCRAQFPLETGHIIQEENQQQQPNYGCIAENNVREKFCGKAWLTFYFQYSLCQNSSMVNSEVVKDNVKRPVKYQIYLREKLQLRFMHYLEENFTGEGTVYSAVFRNAVDEYLKKRGY